MAESLMEKMFFKNKQECPEPRKATVRGHIPEWLQGTLLRNGPGRHTVGDTTYNHWFDGMALLHSFTFKKGEVYYRSKFLRGDSYNSNTEANRIVVSEFGTMAYPDPCKNIFSKVNSYLSHIIPEFSDNCLINIMKCGEDYYATTETNFFRKIDPLTLDTLDKVDYSKYIGVNIATSHPHYDKDGNILNVGTSIADKGRTKYMIFQIPSSPPEKKRRNSCLKHAEVLCAIPSFGLINPSYYHSFGMTENYIIFVEQPFKLDILKLATAYFRGVNWASCLSFHKEEKTWIHVVDKRTKKPIATKFYTDALVVYHHVNAYEEDGHLVVDIIAHKDNSLYEIFYLANLKLDFDVNSSLTLLPVCQRFVIPLHHDKNTDIGVNLVRLPFVTAQAIKETEGVIYCLPEVLCKGIELPRINYDYNGKKYKYIYAAHVEWGPIPTEIVKFNIHTRETLIWKEEHCWPAEPLFVPTPDAKEEDEGLILSTIVTSDPKKVPFLLILDGKTFKEVARASVDVDMHVDLHGIFIPERALSTDGLHTDTSVGQPGLK
ncbi:beta,beta-carotene 15,15'-dioxygenase-like [Rhinatrema bivittatum]|uniref:beta,beta-carotene 15,15'-dioxygenase-like n=1 Tax=Rhinatrema bivittatum TaxID=194408 RepID=UPI00112D6B0C|nr:beta,beta-carotene 15,15'-dioxygenase-like [Rhinatrema bivittatum]